MRPFYYTEISISIASFGPQSASVADHHSSNAQYDYYYYFHSNIFCHIIQLTLRLLRWQPAELVSQCRLQPHRTTYDV